MKCDDCEWREATYRIQYKRGGSLYVCSSCANPDWHIVNECGNADFIERIEDAKLIQWGTPAKVLA